MYVYAHPILYNESLKMKNLQFYRFGHNKNYINILKSLFYIIVNLHKGNQGFKKLQNKNILLQKNVVSKIRVQNTL